MAERGEYDRYVERQKETYGILGTYEIEHALAHYSEKMVAAQQAVEQLNAMDELIELINGGGLPEGHKITTKTAYIGPVPGRSGFPEHGTLIYRPNVEGEWVLDGELVTSGGHKQFLGDSILKLPDNQLVVIDSEHQVGITPTDSIEIVDTINDDYKNTLGGSRLKRHEDALDYVNRAHDGAQVFVDCSYF